MIYNTGSSVTRYPATQGPLHVTRYETLPELGRERPEEVASKVGETLHSAYVTSLVEAQRGTFVLALGRRPRGQCRSC
jgi:hypothetical protein